MEAILILAFGWCAQAEETNGEATEASPSAWTEFWDTFHHPTPWLEMGLDHRFRTVYAENIITLNDDDVNSRRNYQRYRTRWSTKWILGEDIDLNTRLAWEFRTWDEPPSEDRNTNFDEALFDRMNLTLRNMFGMPLAGTFGRQDIILGVGWLVLDGTPLDGSRTIFMDAARFTYDWSEKNTKIDLIYVNNAAEAARRIKPINDQDRALTEQDENGGILYVTNKSVEKTQLEGYFMYKNDNPLDHSVTNMPNTWSRKAEIFTFGGALSGTPAEHWKYRVEGAVQTGTKHDATSDLSIGTERDLQAYGALTNLEYLFNDSHNNSVHVGYEYASGDDPATSDNEQFDLLWAEWPRWSELYIYTVIPEGTVGECSNLHRFNVGHKIQLTKVWQISTDYNYLLADENTKGGTSIFSTSGKTRGQLVALWAKYKVNENLSGHLLGEYFVPGSYYASTNQDNAFFLRFNLEYTF